MQLFTVYSRMRRTEAVIHGCELLLNLTSLIIINLIVVLLLLLHNRRNGGYENFVIMYWVDVTIIRSISLN